MRLILFLSTFLLLISLVFLGTIPALTSSVVCQLLMVLTMVFRETVGPFFLYFVGFSRFSEVARLNRWLLAVPITFGVLALVFFFVGIFG